MADPTQNEAGTEPEIPDATLAKLRGKEPLPEGWAADEIHGDCPAELETTGDPVEDAVVKEDWGRLPA